MLKPLYVLESFCPFVFTDAIHFKLRKEHRYATKVVYIALGITLEDKK